MAPVYGVDVSPDGQTIATAGGPSVFLWSTATGLPIERLPPDDLNKVAVAFAGDGRRLVYSTEDGKVRLWHLDTHRYGKTFNGHGGKVYALAISNDNRLLATASMDRTIKIWSLDSGELERTLRGHQSDVQTVKFGPGNRQIISGSMDYHIKVWNLERAKKLPRKKRISCRYIPLQSIPQRRWLRQVAGMVGFTSGLWTAFENSNRSRRPHRAAESSVSIFLQTESYSDLLRQMAGPTFGRWGMRHLSR